MNEEAEVIGATIRAAGGRNLESNDGTSLKLALELIRTNVKVKTELGDDGEPIARPLGVWRMELLAVSKLKYTQKSIKREFADQLLTNYLSDLFTLETSTSEVRTRTGFATLCCVGLAPFTRC